MSFNEIEISAKILIERFAKTFSVDLPIQIESFKTLFFGSIDGSQDARVNKGNLNYLEFLVETICATFSLNLNFCYGCS